MTVESSMVNAIASQLPTSGKNTKLMKAFQSVISLRFVAHIELSNLYLGDLFEVNVFMEIIINYITLESIKKMFF